jgi:predicted component of viral defense system (DUF524 family)
MYAPLHAVSVAELPRSISLKPQFSLFVVQEARISLDKAFQVLDEEEEDDKQIRAQHMGRWNRYVV